MLLNQGKSVVLVLLVAGAVSVGARALAFPDAKKDGGAPAAAASPANARKDEPAAPDRPELNLAREALKGLMDRLKSMSLSDPEPIYRWSIRVRDAESGRSRTTEERIAAYQDHLNRMGEVERIVNAALKAGQGRQVDALEWEFRRLEAQQQLEQTKDVLEVLEAKRPPHNPPADMRERTEPAPSPPGMPPGSPMMGMGMGGMAGGMGGFRMNPEMARRRMENATRIEIVRLSRRLAQSEDPRNKLVLKMLEQPVPIEFPDETALEDVLKFVKSYTQKENEPALPIYVDPEGLQEVEKTLASRVRMELKGVPLKTTLRLALKQLRLAYCVKDGVLIISSVNGIHQELIEELGDDTEDAGDQ